jgi:hypothetical protein
MNSDVITEAPQDHRTAKQQVNPLRSLDVYTAECAVLQALKRDGYQCMLSGKLDTTSKSELQGKINAAALASLDAQDAVMAAAANPSDSQLARKAAELAKESTKLDAAAQRAAAILANLPNPRTLCVTNAAHIFSESTNTDLGSDRKVSCSVGLQIVFLIRHFLFSRRTMLLVYGPSWNGSDNGNLGTNWMVQKSTAWLIS